MLEEWVEKIRSDGHKITKPRLLVMETLSGLNVPFTAEELHERMISQGVGRATVFRTLKLLQDMGLLVRVHLEEGCQHYQVAAGLPGEMHHHDRIICRECGGMAYLDQCPIRQDVERIVERSGFRMQGHHLDLYGICADCDQASQKERT